MKTEKITLKNPAEALKRAAGLLKAGQLVAFPTETVYGLGAVVWDSDQIKKIFEVKNRPQDNPLIVHIAHQDQLQDLVKDVPEVAQRLMEAFWPGPLTLLFQKKETVPNIVTAGLPAVCVRMPSHPIARGLIAQVGAPIVAPSANLSGKPSPTQPDHVLQDLEGKIAAVLEAGSTEIGIESTVLDILSSPPQILRPGQITAQDIESVIGVYPLEASSHSRVKSPGVKYRHYAPEAHVSLAQSWEEVRQKIEKDAILSSEILLLANQEVPAELSDLKRENLATQTLYSQLRKADSQGVKYIIVLIDDQLKKNEGLMNRLKKASEVNAEGK